MKAAKIFTQSHAVSLTFCWCFWWWQILYSPENVKPVEPPQQWKKSENLKIIVRAILQYQWQVLGTCAWWLQGANTSSDLTASLFLMTYGSNPWVWFANHTCISSANRGYFYWQSVPRDETTDSNRQSEFRQNLFWNQNTEIRILNGNCFWEIY